jgi:hypothetical protein
MLYSPILNRAPRAEAVVTARPDFATELHYYSKPLYRRSG